MTSRERVLCALDHREPDRVPVDFGGTFATSIHWDAYENLRKHVGFAGKPLMLRSRALVAQVDPELMQRFGVDTCLVKVAANGDWRKRQDGKVEDAWGCTWDLPEGVSSYQLAASPLQHIAEPKHADLQAVPQPFFHDPGALQTLDRDLTRASNTGKAVVLNLAYEMTTRSYFLRGFSNWLIDMLAHPEFFAGLLDRVLEVFMQSAEKVLAVAKGRVDVIYIADDLSMQSGPLYHPEIYRRHVKPRQRDLIRALKRLSGGARILYHSCGAIRQYIPDLIEIGVDVLNPVQVGAAGMDTRELKREFGAEMSFWGGIDTQSVLPFGTVDEVRQEVRRRIEDLAPGGGFVLAAVHNLRPEVPPENVVAMLEAACEFGKY